MKVLFDARYTRLETHDGISRFTAGLLSAFARIKPVEMLISDERQLAMLPELPWHLISAPTSVREPWVARQVNALKPDIVFTPMQTMGTAGREYRLVSTLHDLIYYTNRTPPRDLALPIRLGWRAYHLAWWPQRMQLRGSDAIVTVSETTRDLMLRHRLAADITVVYNAADAIAPVVRTAPGTKSLVYMGSFMPYKGVATLARAVSLLPGFTLHLMSRISDSDRSALSGLAPNGSLVFHNGASDDEYAATLQSATALVSASRDEGFGIPLVEAMKQGTPIVVSDIPIFREIGGEAALYFPIGNSDDADAQALATAMRQLELEWQARSVASLAEAARFDWDRSARVLLDLLERVVAS